MTKHETTPSSASSAPVYRIKSLLDFQQIPYERLAQCLLELGTWLRATRICGPAREVRDPLGGPSGFNIDTGEFVWADDGSDEQAGRNASAGLPAGSVETRMDSGFRGGGEVGTNSHVQRLMSSEVAGQKDAREIAEIWDLAKAEAAMYVAAHCVDGEAHAKHIMSQPRPKITPNPYPKTGIKVADITQLQRDLARLAAGANSDVASACARAQAVIEGLLSGLDAEQLS